MEILAKSLERLETHDVVCVRYPASLSLHVVEAEAAWRAFYALPMEKKRAFGYQPDTLVSGVGYQGPETGCDPKEHFHVRLSQALWLRTQAAVLNEPAVTRFIEAGLRLAELVKPFARRDFLEPAESEFGLSGLMADAMRYSDEWTLRFLHYFGECEPGEVIAASHLDKGPMTGHLYESDAGFQRLTREGKWEDVRFGDGSTAIIAGAGLQYRSRCRLTAVCHRVVATARTAREGRVSIVLFMECDNIPHYNKPKYGSMQSFPPGFNYGMPFSEYAELFV